MVLFLFPRPSLPQPRPFPPGFWDLRLSWSLLRGWWESCGCTCRTEEGGPGGPPKGRGSRGMRSCPIPQPHIKSLRHPEPGGHSPRRPEGTKAAFLFHPPSSLPASPWPLLDHTSCCNELHKGCFPPWQTQLPFARFQEMLISGINWGLICIPYGLLAVCS